MRDKRKVRKNEGSGQGLKVGGREEGIQMRIEGLWHG